MESAVLLLGSNIGDKAANINQAIQLIQKNIGKISQTSSMYESEPWGNQDQDSFYNQAVLLQIKETPEQLLAKCQAIELELGRDRKTAQKWTARTIDIDILIIGSKIINTPNLKVPHPELQNRNFALIPLMELLPEYEHPVLNKPIDELYFDSNDELEVLKLEI